MKYGILTDTTCDLNDEILNRLAVKMLPLGIHFGENEIYKERVEITRKIFFKKISESEINPTTSQPSIGLFVDKYTEMLKNYDKIISIHISDKFSGTVQSARMAADEVDKDNIIIIDSRSVSLGLGYLVLLADRLRKKKISAEEIEEILLKARENLEIYFTVNDLSYLNRGGRIGKASAFMGNIFNFYPVLSIPGKKGEIIPVKKVRGKKKIAYRLLEIVKESTADEKNVWIGLLHSANMRYYSILENEIKQYLGNKNFSNYKVESEWISSIVGCHTGPEVYGVVILKGDILNNE